MIRMLQVTPEGIVRTEKVTIDQIKRTYLEMQTRSVEQRDRFIWVDVDSNNDVELKALAGIFNFHELTIEDALTPTHYPKLEDFGQYRYMILRTLRPPSRLISEIEHDSDEEQLTTCLSLYLAEDFVVTHTASPLAWLTQLFDTLGSRGMRTAPRSSFDLTYRIVDILVDRFMRDVVIFDNQIESMEQGILQDFSSFDLAELIDFKRDLVTLKNIVRDLRVVAMRLSSEVDEIRDGALRRYFRDIDDHIRAVMATLEKQVDNVAGLRDVYFAMANVKLGDIMRVLAIITTIGVPLQFVVGLYGMNFDVIPLVHDPRGFWAVIVAMLLLVAVMLEVFRRKRWI